MPGILEEKIKKYKNEYNKNNQEAKLNREKIETARQIVFIILGFINVIFASTLREKLPYIIGITSVIIGSISLIKNIKNKEYQKLETMRISRDFVSVILGVMILLKGEHAIPFIAIVWGISGLQKASKGLNIALYNRAQKKPFFLELLHSTLELIFAILLIFNPFEKLEEHLIILGIEMIISSLKIGFKDKVYQNI